MQEKYIEFMGKHPKEKKENRIYKETPEPGWRSYGCSYSDELLKVDIDDYNKKTNELDEPIKGTLRSEAIINLLDDRHFKYNGIRTDHGVQLFFKKPSWLEEKNKINWRCLLGVKVEYKFPASDDHIPLKVNGVERKFFEGSIDNEDVDELPFWLYPLQAYKHKPFDLNFPEGDRTQKLGAYLFHLVDKGYTPEQAFNVVRFINGYIFERPIMERTLEAEILNESTLAKLQESQRKRNDKNLSHVSVANEIIDRFDIITVNGDCYSYEGGIYRNFSDDKIRAYICEHYPNQKENFRKEVLFFIKGKSFQEAQEEENITNVKNGILTFDEKGNVTFSPHSKETICFRQFNADYNPSAKCEELDQLIDKVFMKDAEQKKLFNQLLGYLLMNHVAFQRIFFFVGAPGTGKTTVSELITNFCGKENVSAIQLEDFNKPFGLASIVNKTANIFSDLKKTKMIGSDTFKMLADGSPIKINQKYRQEFVYRFTGKMIFGMNDYPDFSNDFAGVKRRIEIFKFDHVFDEKAKDFNPHIKDELSKDAECMSSLLNMALVGYKDLIKNKGFTFSKASKKGVQEFVYENDNVSRWVKDCSITKDYLLREPIKLGNKGSYPEYQAFCFGMGEEPRAQKDFTKTIKEKFGLENKQKEMTVNQERLRFQAFIKK